MNEEREDEDQGAAVQDQPEQAVLEKWLLGAVFASACGAVAALAEPVFMRSFDALAGRLCAAPWHMLLATGLVLCAVALPDILQSRRL